MSENRSEGTVRKIIAALMLITPVALTGCGSDDTYVVNPPAAQAAPSSAVVVPQGSTVTKICPAGASTC
jgi:hypothetical protein